MSLHRLPLRRTDRGFGLVETLVALTLLALGLLGGMALLIAGLRSGREALQREAAVALAADLGERLRANRAAAVHYRLDADSELAAPDGVCVAAAPCTPEARARLDLEQWLQQLQRQLPGAEAVISVPDDADSPQLVTVELRWSSRNDAATERVTLDLTT